MLGHKLTQHLYSDYLEWKGHYRTLEQVLYNGWNRAECKVWEIVTEYDLFEVLFPVQYEGTIMEWFHFEVPGTGRVINFS